MSVILDTISKQIKITDYLASKNVSWNSHEGDRYKYRCPLPTHTKDNTPSFFVYDKPDGQDFYCYGCKCAGGIVQLVSAYDQLSIRDTVERLLKGLNINIDDVVDSIIREIIVYSESGDKDDKDEGIVASSLFISSHMHDFLTKVDFNSEDLAIAEKVFAMVDSYVLVDRLDDLEKLAKAIPARTKIRYEIYLDKKKREEIEKLRGSKVNEI